MIVFLTGLQYAQLNYVPEAELLALRIYAIRYINNRIVMGDIYRRCNHALLWQEFTFCMQMFCKPIKPLEALEPLPNPQHFAITAFDNLQVHLMHEAPKSLLIDLKRLEGIVAGNSITITTTKENYL